MGERRAKEKTGFGKSLYVSFKKKESQFGQTVDSM